MDSPPGSTPQPSPSPTIDVDRVVAEQAFDEVWGGHVENPYLKWADVRRQTQVFKGDLRVLEGLPPLPDRDADIVFATMGFDVTSEVLHDSQTYSSKTQELSMGPVMGRTILGMDQPDHRAHRALVQQGFTKRSMERWEPEIVAPIIDSLIDTFVDQGAADLVNELTFRFPIRVIAGILGLSTDELPEFHTWAIDLLTIRSDPPRGLAASSNLRNYFADVLADRRRHPTDDMITSLAQAELDGDRLTDEAIYSFLLLLLPAGAETTFRSSSNLLFGLLTHTDQLDAVCNDRTLIPRTIEEGIRWEGPITIGTGRLVTRDTVLGGIDIPAGSLLDINVAAANHDDTRWDRPEEFDIFRAPQTHLAFSSGPHVCLGMHLARMETAVMLNRVLDRLPNVRLDPDAAAPRILGHWFRAPAELRVVFD